MAHQLISRQDCPGKDRPEVVEIYLKVHISYEKSYYSRIDGTGDIQVQTTRKLLGIRVLDRVVYLQR